jgi:hypothetical protein
MKKLLLLLTLWGSSLLAMAQVNVSINIGEPDYYGVIQFGSLRPQLIYPDPVIIVPGKAVYEPMYLRVPPGHYKNWRRYCGQYNACGRPVYFVKDDWYRNDFVPYYKKEHPGRGHAYGHDKSWKNDQGNWKDDHGKHDKHHGKSKGQGRGKHD